MADDSKQWSLKSGEELHGQYPDTFHLPTLAERQGLRPGDAAKCIFVLAHGVESRSRHSVEFAQLTLHSIVTEARWKWTR